MKNNKNCILSIRCSEDEKNLLLRSAEKRGKNISRYILDSALAGNERKSDKEKRRVVVMIENQMKCNDIYTYMESNNCSMEVLKKMVKDLLEGGGRIWEF